MAETFNPAERPGVRRVIGPTILLGSGSYFDFEDPASSNITIEDIAYGLAFTCRFAGHCRERSTGQRVFYSVAEHCVRMSEIVPVEHAYDALMHELGEAVCGDMTSPLKSICPDYKAVEKRCQAALERRFSVTMRDRELIKHFDLVMLATEQRDLMPTSGEQWGCLAGIKPLEETIVPRAAENAAVEFIERYDALVLR